MVELLVTIGIIGILAAIALPNFIRYREKGYDAKAESDAKNAYTSAQAYFNEYPGADIDHIDKLHQFGFVLSQDVSLTVQGGELDLRIFTKHTNSDNVYTVDEAGRIKDPLHIP